MNGNAIRKVFKKGKGYQFSMLFTQKIKSGINASEIPDSALYSPERLPYKNAVIIR
jgi:hypothetical protein